MCVFVGVGIREADEVHTGYSLPVGIEDQIPNPGSEGEEINSKNIVDDTPIGLNHDSQILNKAQSSSQQE